MVFILGASSWYHAFETLPTEEKSSLKEKIHTIPGFSSNNYAKNPREIVQSLLLQDFAQNTKIIRHDVLNNS